jgi:hypothetical protein
VSPWPYQPRPQRDVVEFFNFSLTVKSEQYLDLVLSDGIDSLREWYQSAWRLGSIFRCQILVDLVYLVNLVYLVYLVYSIRHCVIAS